MTRWDRCGRLTDTYRVQVWVRDESADFYNYAGELQRFDFRKVKHADAYMSLHFALMQLGADFYDRCPSVARELGDRLAVASRVWRRFRDSGKWRS